MSPSGARAFSTREALLLGFCATFIVIARAALRLHLHVPGHQATLMMFFLILARACVPRLGAATLVGAVAGVLAALLGLGRGPLVVPRLLLPGVVVDLGFALVPALASRAWLCAAVGALAASTRGLLLAPVEWLLGVTPDLLLAHVAASSLGAAAFGGLGGALVPPIQRRLLAHGLLPDAPARARTG